MIDIKSSYYHSLKASLLYQVTRGKNCDDNFALSLIEKIREIEDKVK